MKAAPDASGETLSTFSVLAKKREIVLLYLPN
jgi:hypothetical protein